MVLLKKDEQFHLSRWLKNDELFCWAWRMKEDDLGLIWQQVAELEEASWGGLVSKAELGKRRKVYTLV